MWRHYGNGFKLCFFLCDDSPRAGTESAEDGVVLIFTILLKNPSDLIGWVSESASKAHDVSACTIVLVSVSVSATILGHSPFFPFI